MVFSTNEQLLKRWEWFNAHGFEKVNLVFFRLETSQVKPVLINLMFAAKY